MSITGYGGATVEFAEGSDEKMTVTYTASTLVEGNQYLLLVIKGTDENPDITASSILYIDQAAAVAGKDKASVTFTVYPSSIQDSVILIAGAGKDGTSIGPLKAAIIEAKYILGDVDGSGSVDIGDATALLRYIAGSDTADKINAQAADVDSSGNIDVGDATKLLRVLAEIETL
jgi:hypothetical protein